MTPTYCSQVHARPLLDPRTHRLGPSQAMPLTVTAWRVAVTLLVLTALLPQVGACAGESFKGKRCQTANAADSNLCDTCTACAEGKYQDSDLNPGTITQCTACAAGKLGGTDKTAEAAACADCTAGKYSGAGQAYECNDCTEGKASAAGASSCTPCASGSYATGYGNAACTLCAAGKSAEGTDPAGAGVYEPVSCHDCNVGSKLLTPAGSATCTRGGAVTCDVNYGQCNCNDAAACTCSGTSTMCDCGSATSCICSLWPCQQVPVLNWPGRPQGSLHS